MNSYDSKYVRILNQYMQHLHGKWIQKYAVNWLTGTINKLNTNNDRSKTKSKAIWKLKESSEMENWKSRHLRDRKSKEGKSKDEKSWRSEWNKENPENWTPLYEDQGDAISLEVNTEECSEQLENWERPDNRNSEIPENWKTKKWEWNKGSQTSTTVWRPRWRHQLRNKHRRALATTQMMMVW